MIVTLDNLFRAAAHAPPERLHGALQVLEGRAVAVEPGTVPCPTEAYLSRAALAQVLGVSPWTIWRWRPPSHDMGGRPKFLLSEVHRYLASDEFKCRMAGLRAERGNRRSTAQPSRRRAAATSQVTNLCAPVMKQEPPTTGRFPTNKPGNAKENDQSPS